MILLVCVAILGGCGAMVALWPLGWLVALAVGPVAASLLTALAALTVASLPSQREAPLVSPGSAPAS
jgi:hypothetical protein